MQSSFNIVPIIPSDVTVEKRRVAMAGVITDV
ncbi:hypothetical protein SAMN05216167_11547 [Spirosoma endophyticum]|uniref:Uncharacterized protein n=1 Tax=Spirosoma endophyticum TaxID=662367 RepID=A0A1I2BBG2_9BACT|nr:hypothetical protein SAMN05216167_11547 [Spirosoma endophyticum]